MAWHRKGDKPLSDPMLANMSHDTMWPCDVIRQRRVNQWRAASFRENTKNIFVFDIGRRRWMWQVFKIHSEQTLQWRNSGRDGVSNHQPHHCLLNGLFRRRSKKTSKLCVTGLYAGSSPVTGEFPAQMASNAENISIWERHHGNESIPVLRSQYRGCRCVGDGRSERISIHGFGLILPEYFNPNGLTHWGLVTPFGDIDLGQHWLG